MSLPCPRCGAETRDADACATCGAISAPNADADPRIGTVVAGGQYRVLARLGAGGFGVVYEVETVVGGLRRALKVLNRRFMQDDEAKERFVNEALVLEQVNHPNVARCYAAGRLEDGDLYLLLELIHGVPLARLEAPLAPARAVRLAKQIAAGLRAAHGAGVLHRDLKPDNVLVVAPGSSNEHVRLVDFGIAKLTEGGSTSTRTIVGTPEYMAPEQFLPGSALDYRVDLWQLGATLYTMLTGAPPYRGTHPGHIAAIAAQQQRHQSGLGRAPSEESPELAQHPALDRLVQELLAGDPERRPTSAADVCHELARIEDGMSKGRRSDSAEALLGALCATPSRTGWLALHGYLNAQRARADELVPVATRLLASWPDPLRAAPSNLWEASRHESLHPLWPLVRTLDLAGRGLTDEDAVRLSESPALAAITRLDLSRNEIGNEGLAALAASKHLGALVHLDLSRNHVRSGGVEALSASERLPNLRSLRLADNGIGARGARALGGARFRLTALDLAANDLGAEGARALAEAESLSELTSLSIADNGIGPDGLSALSVSRHLRSLTVLDLTHNGVGPGGAAALALSEGIRGLVTLSIGENGLGREGVQFLLSSNVFDHLEALDLAGNRLTPSGAMLLASSPFVRRLKHLSLSDDALGDAGLAALFGSPHLAGIRSLSLARNDVTAAGASLLTDAPPQLERLDLGGNAFGDAGGEAIAAALGRLRISALDLKNTAMGGDGLAAVLDADTVVELDASFGALSTAACATLARSRGLARLGRLALVHCELGPDGVAALFGSQVLDRLRALDLSSNGLGDEGVTALVARAPLLPRLEELGLDDDGLGPDACEALAASPLAGHLSSLRLAHNRLGDGGAEALAKGGGFHALTRLDLATNGIGLSGAAAVAQATSLAALERIDLDGNALTGLVDVHSLAHDHAALMEESFARVAAMGADFAERFYSELFARQPGVKPLFAKTSMVRQQRHLVSSLALVIDHLRQPDVVEESLRELGRRHVGYGVVPTHYHVVSTTLLDTLRDLLGDEWNDELEAAWSEGLRAISSVMLEASKRRPAASDGDGESATVRERPNG